MGDIKTTPFSIIYDSKKNFVIYLHYCLVTNKIYIGQTCQNPEYRWNHGKGYIKNECFYNDIQKYGWDEGFKHLILETNLNAQEANEREKFWIEYYNSYSNGYNKTSGGYHWCFLENKKEAVNFWNKNKLKIGNSVKVICVETGEIFNSRTAAAKFINKSDSGILKACRDKNKTAGGYHWKELN